jgi:hypothetical protein
MLALTPLVFCSARGHLDRVAVEAGAGYTVCSVCLSVVFMSICSVCLPVHLSIIQIDKDIELLAHSG